MMSYLLRIIIACHSVFIVFRFIFKDYNPDNNYFTILYMYRCIIDKSKKTNHNVNEIFTMFLSIGINLNIIYTTFVIQIAATPVWGRWRN